MGTFKCTFCVEIGIDCDYEESDMVYHPQSGDGCCLHCSHSILFKDCGFCDNYKDEICILTDNKMDRLDSCDKWTGETYNIDI